MGGFHSRPYLRFAAISLLILTVVSSAALVAGIRLVAVGQHRAAAQYADRFVGSGVSEILVSADPVDGLSDNERSAIDKFVAPLLAGNVRGVRVFDATGAVAYARGDTPDVAASPVERTSRRAKTASGDDVFVTVASHERFAIEISEDVDAVDGAIADARLELLLAIGAFGMTAWVLSLGAFWFGIRTFTQEHGELAYLYDTGQQLRESLDLHDVLTRIAGDATSLAHGRYGLVALIDEPTGELLLKTTYDHSSGGVVLHQRALDEWFVRRCVATNTTVVTSQGVERYRQYFLGEVEISRDGSLLCVPMSVREKVIGAVAVVRPGGGREGSFSPSEVRLVEELASQAVTAVEQAQLFAKVRADATALEQGYDTTLKALMAALDAKDDATEGHCERVAKLTVHLAKSMDVAPALLVHIERGALLHDVGKIGVPDTILKKPKALNAGEWEAMRKHPLLAGLMVSKIGFLEPALPILLYHHERYDGTGYPFGLSGENIPVEARIFSIVDAYDAMTSDRPYRAAMSHDEAMDEVRSNSSLQFDPDVVQAFDTLLLERPELRQSAGRRILDDDHDHEDIDIRRDDSAA